MEDRAMRRNPTFGPALAGLLLAAALATAPATRAPAAADVDSSASAVAHRLADQERYAEALTVIQGALARNPADTDLLWLEAGVTGWAGRHREAVRLYEALVAAHPGMADDVALDLATERLWADDTRGALRDLDAYLAAHPGELEARHKRALVLAFADRLPDAASAYRQLIAEDPGDLEARAGYARVLNWQGRHREAARAYRDLLKDGATDPDVKKGLAYAEYWAGRPDRARQSLSRLSGVGARDPEVGELSRELDGELRPALILGGEFSHDSDDLNLGTGTFEYRHPVGERDMLSYSARTDHVRDGLGDYDLRRAGLGYERIWSYVWQTHLFANLQFRGTDLQPFLYDAWATCRPLDRLRVDGGVAREAVMTRRGLALGMVYVSPALSADWQISPRWAARAEHRESFYSDGNRLWRTEGDLRFRLLARRGLRVELGAAASHLAAEHDLDHGYYDPSAYVELGGLLDFGWQPSRGWGLDLGVRLGRQQERFNPGELFYGLSGQLEIPVARHLGLVVEGSTGDSNLASESGYRQTSGGLSLRTGF
jgi:Tfp pilus assembly protein PilF